MSTVQRPMPENPPLAENDNPPTRDHRQEVTDSIIDMLEQGVAPWQKPWQSVGLPINPTTEREYRGGNSIYLMATGLNRGYEDPRWMTYKQAAENGWQVKKGEKGTHIEFWEVKHGAAIKEQPDQTEGELFNKPDRRFIHRVYTVFNAKQIDGIPTYAPKERTPFEVVETGERVLNRSGADIKHDQANRCFYSRSTDSIHLTPKDTFKDAQGYYGTALHELAHWTGHSSRLNRSTLNESHGFGDPMYAREELRAEMASLFIAAETGIPHDPATHAAYVGSWIEALRKDKNEIFRAAHDASAAADLLIGLSRSREIEEKGAEANRESLRYTARLEPSSGTVSVHDKRFGNDHHTPIDAERAAGPGSIAEQRDRKAIGRIDLSESFQEARALAVKELGQEARTYVAQTQSGTYCGKIIGQTEHHLVQSISSKTAVAHLKQLVDGAPEINRNVVISYRNDKTQIRELRERSKTAELVR